MKSLKIISSFFVIGLLFFSLNNSVKADNYQYDLGISTSDIWLSKTTLIKGDSIRIYARVHNFGSLDNSGYVTFYNGTQLVDQSQVVTILPGTTDEVWVDFTVPQNDFNILARIMGISPQDDNPSNNEGVTTIYHPLLDSDGDGIPDNVDPDNDNDNLPNIQETQIGTNPLNPDSDGDGVNDSQDFYPLDPNRTVQETVNQNTNNNQNTNRNIFAPINFKKTNAGPNENDNVNLNLNQNKNINLNTNLNIDLNNLLDQSNNDSKYKAGENFFSLKNLWFDLIIGLLVLIIIAIMTLIFKKGRQKENLANFNDDKLIADFGENKSSNYVEPITKKQPTINKISKKSENIKIKVRKVTTANRKKININDESV